MGRGGAEDGLIYGWLCSSDELCLPIWRRHFYRQKGQTFALPPTPGVLLTTPWFCLQGHCSHRTHHRRLEGRQIGDLRGQGGESVPHLAFCSSAGCGWSDLQVSYGIMGEVVRKLRSFKHHFFFFLLTYKCLSKWVCLVISKLLPKSRQCF